MSSCCGSNCGCDSGCKCGGCGKCQMFIDLSESIMCETVIIVGLAPAKAVQAEGSQVGVGSETAGSKFGNNYNSATNYQN